MSQSIKSTEPAIGIQHNGTPPCGWRTRGMGSLESSDLADVPVPAITPVEAVEKPAARLELSPRLQAVLSVLLEAHLYAQDLQLDSWDFAVELSTLRPLGLTNSDFRWLAGKGLVECGCELTLAGDKRRSFRQYTHLDLTKRTCLVLTSEGVVAAEGEAPVEVRREPASTVVDSADRSAHWTGSFPELIAAASISEPKPTWDRDRQQLRLGKVIVKQFKVPAANQETVLAAFQEEDWPVRIDDPLSPKLDQDPKRRLHDTINSLNRNQKRPLVRFLGDGSGQGVRWEFISSGGEAATSRSRPRIGSATAVPTTKERTSGSK
jgi:hypothetical protein